MSVLDVRCSMKFSRDEGSTVSFLSVRRMRVTGSTPVKRLDVFVSSAAIRRLERVHML